MLWCLKPNTFELFPDRLYPESKKEIIAGIPRCKDVFFKFVKVDEVVKVGENRLFTGFAPLTGEEKQVKLDFYQSDPEVSKAPGRGLVIELNWNFIE